MSCTKHPASSPRCTTLDKPSSDATRLASRATRTPCSFVESSIALTLAASRTRSSSEERAAPNNVGCAVDLTSRYLINLPEFGNAGELALKYRFIRKSIEHLSCISSEFCTDCGQPFVSAVHIPVLSIKSFERVQHVKRHLQMTLRLS